MRVFKERDFELDLLKVDSYLTAVMIFKSLFTLALAIIARVYESLLVCTNFLTLIFVRSRKKSDIFCACLFLARCSLIRLITSLIVRMVRGR